MRACKNRENVTLTVKSCTRAFWMGVEKGSERVRTPPLVFTTDCSFRLYPKMNLICSRQSSGQTQETARELF